MGARDPEADQPAPVGIAQRNIGRSQGAGVHAGVLGPENVLEPVEPPPGDAALLPSACRSVQLGLRGDLSSSSCCGQICIAKDQKYHLDPILDPIE